MAVKLRLARIGKKHAPFYRIVAIDERKKRDGEYLDNIGTYDVLNSKMVQFHDDLMEKWLKVGAQPTDSVKKLHKMYLKEKQVTAAR